MDGLAQLPWDNDTDIERPVAARTRKLADTLFAEIINGVYRYGTRLPPERQLSESHSLSRSTIREALGHLERHGIIKRRAGSGSVVCYRPGEPASANAPGAHPNMLDLSEIGETTSPLELGVVRSIVEPEIARLAVLNMSSRDIQGLNAIQQEIDLISVDGARFSALDDELRMQIARGTHNPLLITIYEMVNYVSKNADWAAQRRNALTPDRISEYRLQNRSLCEAIGRRDIEAAVEYLKISLADFHQDLMRGA
ncbi:MAG: FadR family transcriptional regulator [Hyphomicrobiales bacterium]|nr:FadR family transcriptional regulator [Hyphomicrobiales bacterium]MCP4998803.1 FadR family transcriptional regulator [Hyphomicrobiales bacterium]